MSPGRVRLSREDVLGQSGADTADGEELLSALVKAGVISTGHGGFFDEHAVVILQCARALAEYGVEPRHLRGFRAQTEREFGLIESAVRPVARRSDSASRAHARELAGEAANRLDTIRMTIIRAAVDRLAP